MSLTPAPGPGGERGLMVGKRKRDADEGSMDEERRVGEGEELIMRRLKKRQVWLTKIAPSLSLCPYHM